MVQQDLKTTTTETQQTNKNLKGPNQSEFISHILVNFRCCWGSSVLCSEVRNILWILPATRVMSCVTLAEYCAALSCSYCAGKVKCHNKVAAYGSLSFFATVSCSSFGSWRSTTTLLQDLVWNAWVAVLIADRDGYIGDLMATEEKSPILRFATQQKLCRSWCKIGQKWSELLTLLTLTYSQP